MSTLYCQVMLVDDDEAQEGDTYRCLRCSREYKNITVLPLRAVCQYGVKDDGKRKKNPPKYELKPEAGVGTSLKKLLSRVGMRASKGCRCNSYAKKLDANGVAWARENVEEVVDFLEKEAKKRKVAKLLFSRFVARRLVLKACDMAEKAEKKKSK